MNRIALPIKNGLLSEYLGSRDICRIFDIDDYMVVSVSNVTPEVGCDADIPAWASRQGITDIVAFKIDKKLTRLFSGYKINQFIGIGTKDPDEIIKKYINGELKSDNSIIDDILHQEDDGKIET